MNKEIFELLRETPMMLSRAGWTYHPPMSDAEGKLLLGFPEYDAFTEICQRFSQAGVRVFLTNLPVGWIDEDTYDFSSMDETLEKLFDALPDALYIPRLRLDPPFAWMEKHPEDVCVFEGESTDSGVIAALVRDGRVNNTYNLKAAPQPNGLFPLRCDEPIGLQSFSSQRWIDDAARALEAALCHLLEGPHKARFAGFHICFGGTCELLHWGNGGSRIGDFSKKHTEAFFAWALAKYGSLASLRTAWDAPALTEKTVTAPPAAVRFRTPQTPEELYNQDGNGCYYRDYELFHSESVLNAFFAFADVAKRVAPDLAVGVFYGYEGYGHEHLDGMLSSDRVDYLSAPKSYYDPAPGGCGGSVARVASVMRKKLWVEEIDNRLHTAWDPRTYASHINVTPAENLAESANVLWREVCKLEQDGANWWWMDQGDARHRWYDSDEIMAIVADQVRVHRALKAYPAKNICQVLLISDTAANYMGGIRTPLGVRTQMLSLGFPFHEYRMSDLAAIDLSDCRLLIFTQPMLMTKATLDKIRTALPSGAQILFTDLPGVCAPSFSLSRVKELTGIGVCVDGMNTTKLRFEMAKNEILARNGNVWLCIDPASFASVLPRVAEAANIKKRIPAGKGVVHGNTSLFGVFATREEGMVGDIALPQKTTWYEWFTKTVYHDTDTVNLRLAPKEARVFLAPSLYKAIQK